MKKYQIEISFPGTPLSTPLEGRNPGIPLAVVVHDLADLLSKNPSPEGILHDYDFHGAEVSTKIVKE